MICSTRSMTRGSRAPAALCALPLVGLVVVGLAPAARAVEPRSATEPDVLREPAAITRVVDAWDEGGGIDLHFTLGYEHRWKRATLLRELPVSATPGATQRVASFAENTSRLDVRATDRVLLAPIVEVTNMPSAEDYGLRLLGELVVDFGEGFSAAARGGYQARVATSGGPSLGARLSYAF